ncbi:MAG: GGDEF domain-containing protein [Burkholderiales bacterium PBB3]|nr:MAG: GGDEF domain-containing protein [Burkholderiales bacterium PBB3]
MLHYPTLLLVQVGITVLTTLLLIAASLSADALKEQRLWAIGNVVACLGMATGTLTTLPDIVHGGICYALIGLGLALVLRGLRLFCDQNLSWQWVGGLTLLAFILPAYFVLVQPSQALRLIVSCTYLGGINLLCALTLVRGLHGNIRKTMWPSVGGFAALGLSLVVRAAYLALEPAKPMDAQAVEAYMGVTMLVASLAQVAIAFGLIMLVSHRYAEKINRLTLLDGLTGALNRVGLERMGQRVLLRARQGQRSVALAMIDADHFKKINDTYGHPAGDQVLVHLATLLAAQVRPGDLVVRFGGEEFVLVLDGSNEETACRVADRLRGLVEEAHVITGSADIRYQISIGLSSSGKSGYTLQKLIADADAALYRAKQEGRNRVCVA